MLDKLFGKQKVRQEITAENNTSVQQNTIVADTEQSATDPAVDLPSPQPLPPHPQIPVTANDLQKHLLSAPLTVKQYFRMLLILLIPGINILCLLVWGIGIKTNTNKKNFARAALILIFTLIALWLAASYLIPSLLVKIIEGI